MARVRCITEMGMGVDVHGRDATKAARRAVSDAIRHSSLGFFRMLGKTAKDMFVDVTIGVPDPGAVDTTEVAKELPYGTVTVTVPYGSSFATASVSTAPGSGTPIVTSTNMSLAVLSSIRKKPRLEWRIASDTARLAALVASLP